jgi:hypothetical protein
MGSIKVGPTGPKGSAAGIGVRGGTTGLTGTIVSGIAVLGLGPSALTGTIVSGVSGIRPTGPSGGPTGAGITRLTIDTSLSVDTIVLRGDRTAEFFVPSLGEKVLSLLTTPERLEEAIGDFEQGFRLLATRQGLPHAHRWYYWQVIKFAVRSIWPLISELLKLGG